MAWNNAAWQTVQYSQLKSVCYTSTIPWRTSNMLSLQWRIPQSKIFSVHAVFGSNFNFAKSCWRPSASTSTKNPRCRCHNYYYNGPLYTSEIRNDVFTPPPPRWFHEPTPQSVNLCIWWQINLVDVGKGRVSENFAPISSSFRLTSLNICWSRREKKFVSDS